MEKPQISTLSNGLTVITQKKDGLQNYVSIATPVGGRHEIGNEQGATHFLEHMKAFDTTKNTVQQKDRLVKNMRGQWNASTGHEMTSYYFQVSSRHTHAAMELLADSMLRAKMDDEQMEKERSVIQQERKDGSNDPQRIMWGQLYEKAFPGSGIDQQIIGTEETIAGLTKQNLQDFSDKYYVSDDMVLTVVGDVDHAQICAWAEEQFAALPRRDPNRQSGYRQAVYRGGFDTQNSLEAENLDLLIGFESVGKNKPEENMASQLLGMILGGGFSSRLMVNLRGQKGLVYSASAGASPLKDCGLFIIYAGIDKNKVVQATDEICHEVTRLADTLTQDELDTAKNQLIGQLERSTETVGQVGSTISNSYTVNRRYTDPQTLIEQVEAITLDDLKARARTIFASPPTISAYGKGVDQVPSYDHITEKLGHKRTLDEKGFVKAETPALSVEAEGAEVISADRQRGVA